MNLIDKNSNRWQHLLAEPAKGFLEICQIRFQFSCLVQVGMKPVSSQSNTQSYTMPTPYIGEEISKILDGLTGQNM